MITLIIKDNFPEHGVLTLLNHNIIHGIYICNNKIMKTITEHKACCHEDDLG